LGQTKVPGQDCEENGEKPTYQKQAASGVSQIIPFSRPIGISMHLKEVRADLRQAAAN
jgi:hypothetical protein